MADIFGSHPGTPASAYTPWLDRVLAFVIDLLPAIVLQALGYGLLLGTRQTMCATDISANSLGESCAATTTTVGLLSFVVTWLVALAFVVWNYGYRQGTSGSSLGKRALKFRVVSEKTGQPIGFGMSIVRQLAHGVDAVICYVGFLFPLWDPRRQTLADKIVKTVCVPL